MTSPRFVDVVDVAGGTGFLLAEILRRHPDARGVLFDLPAAVADSTEDLDGLRDRCATVGGDFFESAPAGADCYVLSHVIHDRDDDRAVAILRNCRRAMDPNGRLLLVEMVIPPGDEPHPSKTLDMVMLSLPGGMERSDLEYRELLDAAGFELTRRVPTASPVSVIEAIGSTNGAGRRS
jgi:SAM-dependent methyltransferase